MAKKIDPLNKKQYGAVSAILTVSNLKSAMTFYEKAFGFTKKGVMKGPNGKAIHGEMTLRGTTLMMGPENLERGMKSAKTAGGSPTTLYLLAEDVDKVVAKAVKLGATVTMPVMDMFWGDRVGNIVDPEGYAWMIATHKSEPSEKEMAKGMKAMMSAPPPSAGSASA